MCCMVSGRSGDLARPTVNVEVQERRSGSEGNLHGGRRGLVSAIQCERVW